MLKRKDSDPSPLRSGLVHAGLSFAVFGGLVGAVGAGIHFTGDPEEAGPREIIALFDTGDTASPILKARIEDPTYQMASAPTGATRLSFDEIQPSLGVPDPGQTASGPARVVAHNEGSAGVRINGTIVLPGQSLSQVEQGSRGNPGDDVALTVLSAEPVPIDVFSDVSSNGLYASASAGRVPVISDDGRSVATSYARPFANPEGKPTVSLIVRGLGSPSLRRYTKAAIEELPPEVTLSFVASASGLSSLVSQAQDAGHEVLIELPMEPYEDGRLTPLPQRLNTNLSSADITARLEWQLARTRGYFGVLNHQGAKFATNSEAVAPIMASLARRGIAFIEDGSLPESVFAESAGHARTDYAKANLVIDTRKDAANIETQLLTLESIALTEGQSVGTGFPYPVTLDTVTAWAGRLEAKGILLAPASYVTSGSNADAPARSAGLNDGFQTGMQPTLFTGSEG